MGMSASQARLLALQARKSDLEYQGQQINQERTILSQQVTNLYNSLLAMDVPTPPSTADFTKIVYEGTLGTTNYSFESSSVKPGANGYIVTLVEHTYGDSANKNPGYVRVDKANATKFKSPSKNISEDQMSAQAMAGYSVNGYGVYTWEALNSFDELKTQVSGYQNAIKQANLTNENGTPYEPKDFYVYFDKDGNANFVLKSDLEDGNDNAVSWSYIANGEIEERKEYSNCLLTFDPATGRITELSFPVDPNNLSLGYSNISLNAVTETDELAYQQAYADYEYAQSKYEKMQADINAKTEVIQQQDRNLELKLQKLDNERTQITTEIEALEKVINDNIESSYKTFSG